MDELRKQCTKKTVNTYTKIFKICIEQEIHCVKVDHLEENKYILLAVDGLFIRVIDEGVYADLKHKKAYSNIHKKILKELGIKMKYRTTFKLHK